MTVYERICYVDIYVYNKCYMILNRIHIKSSLYTNCQIVRAERNSILQPLLIHISGNIREC
jgi:hypothetical protein